MEETNNHIDSRSRRSSITKNFFNRVFLTANAQNKDRPTSPMPIQTSLFQHSNAQEIASPLSPEFESITELPSPIILSGTSPSSLIDGLSMSSPRPSTSKKGYGPLNARPSTIVDNTRAISEFGTVLLQHSKSPPKRNFSSPRSHQIAPGDVKGGLEREISGLDVTPQKDQVLIQGYSNDVLHTWEQVKQIGKGNFSTVVLAHLLYENIPQLENVAVKIVSLPDHKQTKQRIVSSLTRELELLKLMNHPNIIKLLALNKTEKSYYIITPFFKGGDLFEFASKNKASMTPLLLRKIFAELAIGVSYLHFNNIVHRDLKLENILMNYPPKELAAFSKSQIVRQNMITITDFGLSRTIDPNDPFLTTRCGSEDYVPPELLIGSPYDGRQTDTWALGVSLYALMEGRLPFDPPVPPLQDPNNPNGGSVRSRRVHRVAHRIARIEWNWYKFSEDNINASDKEFWEQAKYIVENTLIRREKRLTSKEVCQVDWVNDILPDELKTFQKIEFPSKFTSEDS